MNIEKKHLEILLNNFAQDGLKNDNKYWFDGFMSKIELKENKINFLIEYHYFYKNYKGIQSELISFYIDNKKMTKQEIIKLSENTNMDSDTIFTINNILINL